MDVKKIGRNIDKAYLKTKLWEWRGRKREKDENSRSLEQVQTEDIQKRISVGKELVNVIVLIRNGRKLNNERYMTKKLLWW